MKSNVFSRWFFVLLMSFSSVLFATNAHDLLPDEANNVDIFQRFSPKVVYVHRLANAGLFAHAQKFVKIGAGSGVIWDDKGHIVTNYHVIKEADNLAITIGKLTLPAKVIGTEPRKDIAVLQVKSPNALSLLKSYVPFQLIHSQDLLIGQKALAIGNPFGLDHSLTIGVISALDRDVPGAGGVTIHGMIQTDASVNPGNSGGPLLDSKGRLIGLNTAIYSNTGSSAGIGFAISSDDLERIVPQIIKQGRASLAGIGISRVEPTLAMRLGIKKGILIANTIPHTPAAAVGLQGTYRDKRGYTHLGDVIVAINGHPIINYDALYNILNKIPIGNTIVLAVERDGKPLIYNVKTIDIAVY